MVRPGIRGANRRCLSLIEESETRAYKGQYEGGQQEALYPVNIAPTSPQISSLRQIADYHLKASDKHFCWMAVNIPRTAPFCETGCTKNTLKASQAQRLSSERSERS